METPALQSRERLLNEDARHHKRAIRQHRDALRACLQELAQLREKLAEHGIALIIGEGNPHGPVGNQERRKHRDRQN